jgi:hypothetical protein
LYCYIVGALKDNCRATVAGSRTYGKGLIQSVYELSDGSGLVLTVGFALFTLYQTAVADCQAKRAHISVRSSLLTLSYVQA